jgi:hypothetical protein
VLAEAAPQLAEKVPAAAVSLRGHTSTMDGRGTCETPDTLPRRRGAGAVERDSLENC